MMHFSSAVIAPRFVFLVTIHIVHATEESKCLQPHRIAFETCSLSYMRMELWCDSTNLTGVPHHDSSRIDTQTPAVRAKRIHLNNSCVAELDPVLLGHYKDLMVFNCDDNEITEIPSKAFSSNTNLEELTLSNNRIVKLDQNALAGLNKLSLLNLRGNRLTRISATDFDQLTRLRTLDLSQNKIKYINRYTFLHTSKIEVLKLNENNLVEISELLFGDLNNLRTVNLARNQLKSPAEGLFKASEFISDVDFSNNNMSCIPKALFKERSEISVFRINNNNVTTPKPEWFRTLWSNRRRDLIDGNLLTNNPWSCGCNAHGYWDFLMHDITDEDWRELLDVECYSPPGLRGKKLTSFRPNFFKECTVSSYDGGCDKHTSDVVDTSNTLEVLVNDIDEHEHYEERSNISLLALPVMDMGSSATTDGDEAVTSFLRIVSTEGFNNGNDFVKIISIVAAGLLALSVLVYAFVRMYIRQMKNGPVFVSLKPIQSNGDTKVNNKSNEYLKSVNLGKEGRNGDLPKFKDRDSGLGDDLSYKSYRQRTMSGRSDVSEHGWDDGNKQDACSQTCPKGLITPHNEKGQASENSLPTIYETQFATPLKGLQDYPSYMYDYPENSPMIPLNPSTEPSHRREPLKKIGQNSQPGQEFHGG